MVHEHLLIRLSNACDLRFQMEYITRKGNDNRYFRKGGYKKPLHRHTKNVLKKRIQRGAAPACITGIT